MIGLPPRAKASKTDARPLAERVAARIAPVVEENQRVVDALNQKLRDNDPDVIYQELLELTQSGARVAPNSPELDPVAAAEARVDWEASVVARREELAKERSRRSTLYPRIQQELGKAEDRKHHAIRAALQDAALSETTDVLPAVAEHVHAILDQLDPIEDARQSLSRRYRATERTRLGALGEIRHDLHKLLVRLGEMDGSKASRETPDAYIETIRRGRKRSAA